MIRTLIVAGIAAFVGKKLYDKGTLDPYIAEARKQLKTAFPNARTDAGASGQDTGPTSETTEPVSFTPPHVVPVG